MTVAITDDLQGHLGLAAVITAGIEILKRLNIPGIRWINDQRPGVMIALSAISAIGVSLGFQWTWEQSWPSLASLFENGGVVKLSLSIPNADTIIRAIGQMVENYAMYHAVVKPAATAVAGKPQVPLAASPSPSE